MTAPAHHCTSRLLGLLLAIAGMTCASYAVADPRPLPPQAPMAASTQSGPARSLPKAAAARAPSPPARIVIPAIGVSSAVFDLGLTATGALEVPQPGPHYNEAGWYRGSPTPGSVGPAVIVGHVDSAAAGPSVFFRLGALRAADRIQVTRRDGTVAEFAVDSVARYAKSAFPTQLVYGPTRFAALRLITCGGRFDHATGHYVDNVVVLAHLVGRNT